MQDQQPYWNAVASEKAFTHPLNERWLRETIRPDARLLDFGCGYGRTLNDLARIGYTNAVGIDFAPKMIARGRREFPDLDLRTMRGLPLAAADATFDGAFLMAVLTCIPDDSAQDAVVRELRRLLRPGGILFVSDMPLQTDERNRRRYADAQPRFGAYGVFQTEDGAVVRHHSVERLGKLFGDFEQIAAEDLPIRTMNAHPATARQILLRLPAN